MSLFKRFLRSESAAAMMPIAISFFVLLGVVGVVIDLSKHYALKNALQRALDASLLGAVSTADRVPVEDETRRLFSLNMTRNYMGSREISFNVTANTRPLPQDVRTSGLGRAAVRGVAGASDVSAVPPVRDEVYDGTFSAETTYRLPNSIMQIFGFDYVDVVARSEVTQTLEENRTNVEVALVLDNTGSMGMPIQKMNDLKVASKLIFDLISGGENNLPNLSFNIVPYEVCVVPPNLATGRNWVKSFWQPRYDAFVAVNNWACIANRDEDIPKSTNNIDISPSAPVSEETRFRTPSRFISNMVPFNPRWNEINGLDLENQNLAPMLFGSNQSAQFNAAIDAMQPGGYTRTNVGMLWGWLSLAPTWRGTWDGAGTLPRDYDENNKKFIVMITDGENTVYLQQSNDVTDDNARTLEVCSAAKSNGIVVYTIGLGPSVNSSLLTNCATDPGKYFYAPTSSQLAGVFQAIADDILRSLIRLSR